MPDPEEPADAIGVEREPTTSTKKAGVGCATTKQSFLGQRSAGFVLPVLRISEEVEPKSKARAEKEETVDHEEVLPLEGGKKVARGEFAEPSSDDTGLAAASRSGGASPTVWLVHA